MNAKIVIAGGSGFIGSAIASYFASLKYNVVVLTRKASDWSGEVRYVNWDGQSFGNWQQELEGALAVINLSGKSVNCRYNDANKAEIYASRLNSTRILGEALRICKSKPVVWINSSSATIYRHTEDKPMTETDGEIGSGFSVDVCKQWEQCFFGFSNIGVRQIALRTAIVLGNGGVMKPFKTLTKLGLGGHAGRGRQMFSWIHIQDLCRAVDYLINHEKCTGIYNLSAPFPVTNHAFMKALRLRLGRKIGLNMPIWMLEFGARLIKTETELLLKSRWVLPQRLMESSFIWQYPHIEGALADL